MNSSYHQRHLEAPQSCFQPSTSAGLKTSGFLRFQQGAEVGTTPTFKDHSLLGFQLEEQNHLFSSITECGSISDRVSALLI